tara:strand:+ start:349 stop:558 length:210 start_codon:yes stop_codon:yes gene_type:complete
MSQPRKTFEATQIEPEKDEAWRESVRVRKEKKKTQIEKINHGQLHYFNTEKFNNLLDCFATESLKQGYF